MKFTTKNVFIGTYVFNFIIIYIVSLLDNTQSIIIPNLMNHLNFTNIYNQANVLSPIAATGYFAVFIYIYDGIVYMIHFIVFFGLSVLYVFGAIIYIVEFSYHQLTYIYTILPSFISGLIVINMVFIIVITFVFGIQIASSRLGDS